MWMYENDSGTRWSVVPIAGNGLVGAPTLRRCRTGNSGWIVAGSGGPLSWLIVWRGSSLMGRFLMGCVCFIAVTIRRAVDRIICGWGHTGTTLSIGMARVGAGIVHPNCMPEARGTPTPNSLRTRCARFVAGTLPVASLSRPWPMSLVFIRPRSVKSSTEGRGRMSSEIVVTG